MRSSFDPATLPADDALSFELFNAQAERDERLFAFRDHGYIFDQMNGAQSRMPAFLINIHRVSNLSEAEAYVSRIRGMGPVLDQLSEHSAERAATGIQPPHGVSAHFISAFEHMRRPDNAMLEE